MSFIPTSIIWHGYDDTGGLTVPTSASPTAAVTLAESKNDGLWTFSSNELEFNVTGTYRIQAHASVDFSSHTYSQLNAAKFELETKIPPSVNYIPFTPAGYTTVLFSGAPDGNHSASLTYYATIDEGSFIQLHCGVENASPNIQCTTKQYGSSLTVRYLG
jgi:hypothetical protein